MSTQLAYSNDHAAGGVQARMALERRDDNLRAIGPALHFAQGREIYGEGDDAEVFFKVVSGVVRTCRFLSDGRRQIDAFHVAGEVFGFEAGEEHSFRAEAVNDCAVVSNRRRSLQKLAANNEAVSHQLFSHAMRSLARSQEHVLVLGRRSALEKVAAFLIEWAKRSNDGKTITLAMTRQDIADYLGLTIETVSRTFTQLEREAIIDIPTSREIRLRDIGALRDLNA